MCVNYTLFYSAKHNLLPKLFKANVCYANDNGIIVVVIYSVCVCVYVCLHTHACKCSNYMILVFKV